MSTLYFYRARDKTGKVCTGSIEAQDFHAAGGALRKHGLYITKLQEEKNILGKHILAKCPGRRISLRALSLLCRQMAALLEAGMPLQETLCTMQRQQGNLRIKNALQVVLAKIESGISLKDALAYPSSIFPESMIFSVAAGEASGSLDFVLRDLAAYFEDASRTEEKLFSMMLYPVLLCVMTILVGSFIALYILPTFAGLFAQLHIALPWPTRALLYLQEQLAACSIFFMILLAGALVVLHKAMQKEKWRLYADQWRFKIPVYKRFLYWKCTMETARMLALLLHSGLPVEHALEVIRKSSANQYIAGCLRQVQMNLESGRSLTEAFAETGMFDEMFLQFLLIGENSGDLEGMLGKSADFYAMDLERFSQRMLTMAEPAAILFMGSMIGILVFSVILPSFDAMTAMQ